MESSRDEERRKPTRRRTPSSHGLLLQRLMANSGAVPSPLHTREVAGSIPAAPTASRPRVGAVKLLRPSRVLQQLPQPDQ